MVSFPSNEMNGPETDSQTEQAVDVRGGLMVYSHDGEFLGHVEEFIIDSTGNLTSFVVRSRSTFRQEMRVLMSWIQSVTRETIQLRVTATELLTAAGTMTPAMKRR
jgi:uncharacterized protein YrrD